MLIPVTSGEEQWNRIKSNQATRLQQLYVLLSLGMVYEWLLPQYLRRASQSRLAG